jgi:hypothetical protein
VDDGGDVGDVDDVVDVDDAGVEDDEPMGERSSSYRFNRTKLLRI